MDEVTISKIKFSESNKNVTFHRTQDVKTFPGPPSKPTVVEVLTHSIKLSWQPNNNHGDSPVFAYIVEYFSHATSEVKKLYSHEIALLFPRLFDVWIHMKKILLVFDCSFKVALWMNSI